MRCKRCHAKIDGKKKSCPNCGVLIRRKRGLYKLAPTALGGSSGVLDELRSNLSRIRPGILIAAGGVLLAVIAIICISCVGCSCSGCSCESSGRDEPVAYPSAVNSGALGQEYYHNNTLYYINGDKIFSLVQSGETKLIAEGTGLSALSADGQNVYYLSNGELWAVPFEKPIVVSEDSGSQYAARCLARAAAEGDDPMSAISGYTLTEDGICYWGACQSGTVRVMKLDTASGISSKLFEASAASLKYYRGHIYYIDTATGSLMRFSLSDGETQDLKLSLHSGQYDLGDGSVYTHAREGETSYLDKVSLSGGKTLLHMQIDGLAGIAATDENVFYWKNDSTGGSVMRMSHVGTDAKLLLYDGHPVELRNISGGYFSVVTTSGLDGSLRYWLFDSVTQQSVY